MSAKDVYVCVVCATEAMKP